MDARQVEDDRVTGTSEDAYWLTLETAFFDKYMPATPTFLMGIILDCVRNAVRCTERM